MYRTPLVSIVIPCYNQAHFLDEALQSVFIQGYTNWECIVVNDGSPDNTDVVAEKWLKKDQRFKYLKKENGGLSSARNFGILNSKGVFILPLDSDDVLHPNYLVKTVKVLKEDNSLGIVSCFSYHFTGDKNNIIYKQTPRGDSLKDLMFENIMMASSLFRRDCWLEVGGYDESMKRGFEDWEFWINITKRGWSYTFVEEFLFYYRKSKKSMLKETIKYHAEDNMEYVFKKHREIYIENFDSTLYYLFFLIKRYKLSDQKIKNSIEHKLVRLIIKPFTIFKKILGI